MSAIRETVDLNTSVVNARSFAELREACVVAGVAQDVLTRDRDGEIKLTGKSATAVPLAAEAPARPDQRVERVIYIVNDGLRLTANNEEELDRLEAAIRASR